MIHYYLFKTINKVNEMNEMNVLLDILYNELISEDFEDFNLDGWNITKDDLEVLKTFLEERKM